MTRPQWKPDLSQDSSPRFTISELCRAIVGQCSARDSLWRLLRRDSRHPMAARLRRRLRQGRSIPIVPLSVLHGLFIALGMAYLYSIVGHVVLWLLPCWLMLFSAFYCAFWTARIVPLLTRGSMFGMLDEISVIPPGRIFICMTACRVVLNRDDAVVGLGLLRRILAGMIFAFIMMALCVALTMLRESEPVALIAMLLDLVMVGLVILLEHSQSTVLACLLAIALSQRLRADVDRTGIVLTAFTLLQILSFALAVAAALLIDRMSLGIVLLCFLLIRELLALLLWRLTLYGLNEDGASVTWRAAIDADWDAR